MSDQTTEILSVEAQLAIAHTPPEWRTALTIFLELDCRLSRIVAGTNEPMLGQMRLAWWREQLALAPAQRPAGDAVLDGIGRHWMGYETGLVALVDGWEYMLADRLDHAAASGFAKGRAAPFVSLAQMTETASAPEHAIPARRWALVDAAVHVPDGAEREMLLELARADDAAARLPRAMRGLAVLDALARRALRRGGRPLMEGRGASITAMRAAILGQ
jgi:phytoene synthase